MKPSIVDDDEAITQQLFRPLNDDYDVVTAHDIHTAGRRAAVYEPAVSILDLHLTPELDSPEAGLRMFESLKAHIPDSKILIITSTNPVETRNACYAMGADECLDKPFDAEKLLTTMRRMAPCALQ